MSAVLVTGSSGAIGAELVHAFAQTGRQVIGLDVRPPSDPSDVFLEADLELLVREPSYFQQVIDNVRNRLAGNQVDAIINNAAVQRTGPFDQLDLAAWRSTMDVNVLAPVLLIQAFRADLVATRGSVVNIASIHAGQTKPHFTAYATSKSALAGLTRALAVECGSQFRVNAIAPAAVDTPMLRDGFRDNPAQLDELRLFHPTGSIGSAREIASLAVALCSSQFPFLNGSVVTIDGGISGRLHDPA